jgi:hypothetical protein
MVFAHHTILIRSLQLSLPRFLHRPWSLLLLRLLIDWCMFLIVLWCLQPRALWIEVPLQLRIPRAGSFFGNVQNFVMHFNLNDASQIRDLLDAM